MQALVLETGLLRFALAFSLALGSLPVFADARPELECLSPTPRDMGARLDVPEQYRLRHDAGVVRVELRFSGPTAVPEVKMISSSASNGFTALVLRSVADYRLPCMAADAEPVVAAQEFEFTAPKREVFWTQAVDSERIDSRDRWCLSAPSMWPTLLGVFSAHGLMPKGQVIAELRFVSPGEAPNIRLVDRSGDSELEDFAHKYLTQFRLACLKPTDPPVVIRQVLQFEGGRVPVAAMDWDTPWNWTLATLLATSDQKTQAPVRFDFRQMGCPFDVRIVARQPSALNHVGELDATDPSRAPFLRWLQALRVGSGSREVRANLVKAALANLARSVDLNSLKVMRELGSGYHESSLGMTVDVKVPCAVLDLVS